MLVRKFGLCLSMLLLSASANAEFMGLLNGRSANPGSDPTLSVEAGFVTGDLGGADHQHIGARVNYRLNSELTLYGDFGLVSEIGSADGNPFGIGAYYHLANQRIAENLDMAIKGSLHLGSYEFSSFGFSIEADYTVLSVEALVSSQEPISDNGLSWYGNFGIHRLSVDFDRGGSDSDFEIGFGGGVTLPFGPGVAYAGADYIDDLGFGIGFRYNIE